LIPLKYAKNLGVPIVKASIVIAIALIVIFIVVQDSGPSDDRNLASAPSADETSLGEISQEPAVKDGVTEGDQSTIHPNRQDSTNSAQQPDNVGNSVAHSRSDRERIITTENITLFFYAEPLAASQVLFRAAESQEYDLVWSGQATGAVNEILVATGLREHANDWTIDCRTTICIVQFPDTALADYDHEDATKMLGGGDPFGRVIWFRRYKDNAAYLFLMRSDFEFDRDTETGK